MKISYVVPYGVILPSRAAHSINIMSMCTSFAELGHEVTLILPSISDPSCDLHSFYGVNKNFRIQFVPSIPKKWFYPIYAILVLISVIRNRSDLVIGRSALACLFACWSGFKVIFDSHGPAWNGSRINKYIYLLLRKNKNLLRMTVNSGALKKIYQESGLQPNCPVIVAHNGSFIFSHEEKVHNWPGRPGVLQVGYAGHLYKGRGIDIIVGCAHELPEYDFHIIGGTEGDISYWKSNHQIPNLIFHGFVDPKNVYKYRNMCDVLVAPYLESGVLSAKGKEDSSKYMNPIKLIEYMASKKAIISSDLAPIREILNENNAILLNSYEVSGWKEAIKSLSNSEKRLSLADHAFKDFLENLTWSARARKMLDL